MKLAAAAGVVGDRGRVARPLSSGVEVAGLAAPDDHDAGRRAPNRRRVAEAPVAPAAARRFLSAPTAVAARGRRTPDVSEPALMAALREIGGTAPRAIDRARA